MTHGRLRAFACAAGLLLVTGAQPSAAAPERRPFFRPQQASTSIASAENALTLSVFSFGRRFTLDPGNVRFTLRSRDVDGASPVPFAARVGAPVLDRSFDQAQPPGTMTVWRVRVDFPHPPAHGMYQVEAQTVPGFTLYDDGTVLPADGRPVRADVYWPDESGVDAGLRAVRARLGNRTVYGYGGIVLSCGGASFKTYLADVGVKVHAIERRRGAIERMWTGAMTSRGNDAAYWFLSVDPLAIRADYPSAHEFAVGGSSQPAGDEPCPGFSLADPWHADISVTTVPPPPLPAGYDQFKIAVGMPRAEVARRRGYPQGYFTRAELDRQTEWAYEDAIPDAYTVTFRGGRVAAYTVSRGLP